MPKMNSQKKHQDLKAEKAFFNDFASREKYEVFHEDGYKRFIDRFDALCPPLKDERLLEIGCGTAAFTTRIKSNRANITGIDISVVSLKRAAELSGCDMTAADACFLPFPDENFDTVLLTGVLHHLPDMKSAFEECFRVLSKGGRLFAFDPNGRNPLMWLYRSPKSPFSSSEGRTVNERIVFDKEIRDLLGQSGFIEVNVSGISGITFKYLENDFLKKLLFLYNIIEKAQADTALEPKFGSFLISFAIKPL
jgi:ubiquinone/menaquinone biosynthesis C-methylase UbiE